MKTDAIGQAG